MVTSLDELFDIFVMLVAIFGAMPDVLVILIELLQNSHIHSLIDDGCWEWNPSTESSLESVLEVLHVYISQFGSFPDEDCYGPSEDSICAL